MKIIVCVDLKNGMMFNHRRQSQDRILRDDVRKESQDHVLRMNAYSAKLFEKDEQDAESALLNSQEMTQICVSEDFLNEATEEEFCFVEDQDVSSCMDRADTVILYQWNRQYPADFYFTAELPESIWKLARQEEFAGSSHEKITKTVYERC